MLSKLNMAATHYGSALFMQLPYVLKYTVMQYMDACSLIQLCSTCSELHSMMSDARLWRALVRRKEKEMGVLVAEVARLTDYKEAYQALFTLQLNPRFSDYTWNVVVSGDRRVGKSKLVQSLAASQRQRLARAQAANRLPAPVNPVVRNARVVPPELNDDPVEDAVSGIYRFGIDFVTKRVVVGSAVIKLQVWDGVGDQRVFEAAHVVLLLYDMCDENSFQRLPALLHEVRKAEESGAVLLLVGNLRLDQPNRPRVVPYHAAKRFANERGMMYLEADASDPDSVDKTFLQLVSEVASNYPFLDTKFVQSRSSSAQAKNNCSIL
eukprot:TRINITY_DN2970_c0_g1_i4.p1 TRINITY_DN2970_c0_g1~~TRINITY_DN2970_c0_g1_i4.p1  ORF type:complete len:323 (+),score=76.58 TRINITY_DN2970_c0_g1_i4:115-1083(+)